MTHDADSPPKTPKSMNDPRLLELKPSLDLNTEDQYLLKEFFENICQLSVENSKTIEREPVTLALMSRENPFWAAGRAVAIWQDQTSTLIGFSHPEQKLNGEAACFFGYFACAKDAHAAQPVFAKLRAWSDQMGAKKIVGPIQFKTAYDYRLRMDSFSEKTFWGEPQNPEHHIAALEEAGFAITQEYFTDFILELENVRHIAHRKLSRATLAIGARSPGRPTNQPHIEPFSLALFNRHRGEIFNLANSLFAGNAAFQPLNQFDFNVLYPEALLKSICQNTSFLIFDNEGKLRGLCLSFAHPTDPECLLIKTIGIDAGFRNGGRTFVEALKFIFERSTSYQRLAFCLMTKGNQVHRLTQKYSDHLRRYALFAKDVALDHSAFSKIENAE